jgi:hypothetical protein
MKSLNLVILLAIHFSCFGQYPFDESRISEATEAIVNKISTVNILMSEAVGGAGTRPEQFDNFAELMERGTKDELIELTNHPNEVVRCYAFWALTYDGRVNLFPIVIKHLHDTAYVETQFGCIKDQERVGDFFINSVTPGHAYQNSNKLSRVELKYLDSLLIYTPNSLDAKNKAIRNGKQTEAFYKRVRELVLEENNQDALVALAGFKRENDTSLIIHHKALGERHKQYIFTYRAISIFPHPAFLPFLAERQQEALEKNYWSQEWLELYQAIASYRNETALQAMELPFTGVKQSNVREYHIDCIFSAVQNFYSPIYDDLLWKMWEEEKLISLKVFNLLYAKDPDRAFGLAKLSIQNTEKYSGLFAGIRVDHQSSGENLLDKMLDIIAERDREFTIKVINEKIRSTDVLHFSPFAFKALEMKDSSLVNALFARLGTESNAHIYLLTAEILIAFNDTGINNRIASVCRENKSLTEGWGGRDFVQLLKKHNIKINSTCN